MKLSEDEVEEERMEEAGNKQDDDLLYIHILRARPHVNATKSCARGSHDLH